MSPQIGLWFVQAEIETEIKLGKKHRGYKYFPIFHLPASCCTSERGENSSEGPPAVCLSTENLLFVLQVQFLHQKYILVIIQYSSTIIQVQSLPQKYILVIIIQYICNQCSYCNIVLVNMQIFPGF